MMNQKNNIDPQELEKFSHYAHDWWNESGTYQSLHQLNFTRLIYLKNILTTHFKISPTQQLPLKGIRILDVGCGGGLIAEPLCRLGASVTGIDPSSETIMVAKKHANQFGLDIFYSTCSLQELNDQKTYDVVLAFEILEHLPLPETFLENCFNKTTPGGICVLSTLNRTLKSYLLGIIAAEYLFKWVPKGTHEWSKFLKPSELHRLLRQVGFSDISLQGVSFLPLKNEWILSDTLEINYFASAIKC